MPQPLIDLVSNPQKSTLAMSPANGFVPQTYLPMLKPFSSDYHVVSVPPRALWGDGEPPENYNDYSWMDIAKDMVNAYQEFGLTDVVAIGHSIGGVVTWLSALQQAELFKAIILLDPVILPKMATDWMREQKKQGKIVNQGMVEAALRRRNTFHSVDEAFNNYQGKSIFADWSDEVLRLYAEHGTTQCEDDLRCLTWSPQWEAFYFGTYYTEIWTSLHQLNAVDVPILFVNGNDSDVLQASTLRDVKAILPKADFKTIEGHGHLFPQSASKITGNLISEWVKNI